MTRHRYFTVMCGLWSGLLVWSLSLRGGLEGDRPPSPRRRKPSGEFGSLVGDRVTDSSWETGDGLGDIALRINVRTLLECCINTIAEAVEFIPSLFHPVLEYKPPIFNLVQVWRIGR
jgi:hypothetical protein